MPLRWPGTMLLVSLPAFVFAQAELAKLSGRVVDGGGHPIEGVVIRLTDEVRGGTVALVSERDGRFNHHGLISSEYVLTVEKDGYRSQVRRLSLEPGEEKRQTIRLVASALPAPEVFARGERALGAGDFESAAAAFEEVTRISPETPEGHTNLAVAYFELGRKAPAVQELEKAAELSTESFGSWARLAEGYVRVGRNEAAIRAFRTALEKEHDPSDPMVVKSWMTLGAFYVGKDRVQDAVAAYGKALAGAPGSASALLELGKCHVELGSVREALAYFEQVLSVEPSAAQAEEATRLIEAIRDRVEQSPRGRSSFELAVRLGSSLGDRNAKK